MNIEIREKNNKISPILNDYDKVRKEFNWDSVERELTFSDGTINPAYFSIYQNIEKNENKVGLIWVGKKDEVRKISYHDLALNGSKIANSLKDLGFKNGDRIILFSRKVPELYFTMIGATLAGGILVPVFQSFGTEALKYRIENSGAHFILTHEELLGRVRDATSGLNVKIIVIDGNSNNNEYSFEDLKSTQKLYVERKRTKDPWFIIYTSGSTGRPKGIVQAQNTIALYYISGMYHFDLQDDVFWPTGDPAWVAGYASVWTGWLRRVPVVTLESKFNAEKWLSIIEEFKVSVWSTAPTALRLLKKELRYIKNDVSSLRFIHAGGEYVGPDLVTWTKDTFGVPLHEAYGQSETATYVICNIISLPIKVGSIGKPLPGIEALIVDEKGNPLPPNSQGILAFKPGFPGLFIGIWGNEDRYKEYFKGGYYLTGDLAYMDKDGYFWYLGRADDVIKVSGYRVGLLK